MAHNDFGFSLSENSVNEINSLIEQYSQDIVSIMNGFQDDLIEHISTANYDKLLKAVDGIIELYNNSVRYDLKTTILDKWQEACESMSSFAERMDMGEESEQVASEIEESLASVFEVEIENRLHEVDIDGRTSASIVDFDSVNKIFDSVVKKVQELSDEFSEEAERLGEDNEFYKFIIPVVIAYSSGICSYFNDATKNLENLEDNYISKMAEKRDAVQESKQDVDLSSLLDFSDLTYAGMGGRNQKESTQEKEASSSNEAEGKITDELLEAVRKFNNSVCCYRNMKQSFENHMNSFSNNLYAELNEKYGQLMTELEKYHNELEKNVEASKQNLEKRYIGRSITYIQAQQMYSESCTRAQFLFEQRRTQYYYQYNNLKNGVAWKINAERNRCLGIVNDVVKRREEPCRKIYKDKAIICDRLAKPRKNETIAELKLLIENVNLVCNHPCAPIQNISRLLDISMRAINCDEIDELMEEKGEFITALSKCQNMVDNYIVHDLAQFLPDEKKNLKMENTVVFQDFDDFANDFSDGIERAKSVNGYYSPATKTSHVKNSGPHPNKTAIHEHIHALSDSSRQSRQQDGSVLVYRGGVKRYTYVKNPNYNPPQDKKKWICTEEKYRQMNEALTEYFCKQIMGVDYPPKTSVAYSDNMNKVTRLEKGLGSDLLKEAYFCNKPDILEQKFDSVMGKGQWDTLAKAMDDSLNSSLDASIRKQACDIVDNLTRTFEILSQ